MKHLNFLLTAVFAGLCGANVAQAQSGRTTSFVYDAVGQVTSITTPGGRVRGLQWDGLGRNVQQSFGGASVGYGYNLQSAVTAVQDPRSLVTSYDRNGFGEARSQASPDTGTSSFTYDAAGNLTSRVNAAGQVENNTFDAANRIVTRSLTHPSSGSITYSFSYGTSGAEAGRLVQVSAPGMVLSYGHNLYGQVTSATQALAGTASLTTSYGYANNGAPTSVTYPSGRVVTYTLDAASRIAGITVNDNQVLSGVSYSALGAVTGWSFAGGQSVARTYDTSARLTSVTLPWGTRQYAYDVDDRIVGITDSLLGAGAYGYDSQDRLTSAINGAGTWTYQYDANGNRTGGTSNGSAYGTSVDPGSNRMLAAGQWQNAFTADGQTAQVTNGGVPACGAGLTLGYQADGQLVSSNALSAKHAPNGLRLQKTAAACVGGATTNFVYDTAGHLIGEYDATGAVIQETIWLGDLPVAVFKPGSASPYYVYSDNLGTPRGITNSGGLLVWSWDGEPFGASPPVSGPGPQGAPFKYGLRFPGQYFDEETGYHHNGWREYIPELGRYAQSDPIGLDGGLNTYAYVHGNPLKFKDPRGLDVWIESGNQNEPKIHQSISVGDPKGHYVSFSFGVTGSAWGAVYDDYEGGGAIETYKKTTPEQDSMMVNHLKAMVGAKGFYGVTDICRSWSQRQFMLAPGVEVKPPVAFATPTGKAPSMPRNPTTYTTVISLPSSSTGTSTSR
ncbi:RHS repeat-associated core domain-containing protein [Roseateles sp. MS654]|uniref:RHS repeat-associated core domain-containing protein n=1 Tax=Roseateles sp. MS654 TaxID=3412685 RepID=UPI003C2E0CAE